jgi:hypothetical protein
MFEKHPYPVTVYFASVEQWPALMEHLKVRDDRSYPDASACTVTFRDDLRHASVVVTIRDIEDRTAVEIVGLLVHELVHVVQIMQKEAGSTFDAETQAYLTHALTMWVLDAYDEAGLASWLDKERIPK